MMGELGSNKCYPYLGGKLAEERELRAAAKAGTLQTLTPDQLRLDAHVVTIVPDRMKLWGLAWLRSGDVDVRCTVLVRRWTSGAVGVEVGVDGEIHRCWIWHGACQRLEQREDAW